MIAIEQDIEPPLEEDEDRPSAMVYVSFNTADGHSYSANASVPVAEGEQLLAETALRVLAAAASLQSPSLAATVEQIMTAYGRHA